MKGKTTPIDEFYTHTQSHKAPPEWKLYSSDHARNTENVQPGVGYAMTKNNDLSIYF